MSVGTIIYLVILLVFLIGGFFFFIIMDLKNHRTANDKRNSKTRKAKKHKAN